MRTILVPAGERASDKTMLDTALAAARPLEANLEFLPVRIGWHEAAAYMPHVRSARAADALKCTWDRSSSLPIPPFRKGTDMTETLHADLEALRQQVAQKGRIPILLRQGALGRFHGLSLGEIVKLTDAPALATVETVRAPDGTHTERFSIDGKDPELCHAVARQFLLDPNVSLAPGDVREARTCENDVVCQTLVRDHNDVIYRVTDNAAVVDAPLTRTLQTLQQRKLHVESGARSPSATETEGRLGADKAAAAAHILQALTNARSCNAVARCVVAQLVGSTGERDLETALAAATPEILLAAFQQILSASDEIETLLDGLTEQTNALMQAARRAQTQAVPPEMPMVPESLGDQTQAQGPRTPF